MKKQGPNVRDLNPPWTTDNHFTEEEMYELVNSMVGDIISDKEESGEIKRGNKKAKPLWTVAFLKKEIKRLLKCTSTDFLGR